MLSKNASLIKHNQIISGLFRRALSSSTHVIRNSETLINPKYKQYSYAMSKIDNVHLICDTVFFLIVYSS
jgi:hypothetical protein